jgi:long-chain acyl-CoA synthetase
MHPSVHAAQSPNALALIMAETGATLTYAQLDCATNKIANGLRALGVKVGDVIALMAENSPAFFEIVWGAQRAGLYYVCISSRLTAGEVAYILKDSGARYLFASATLGDVAGAAAREAGLAGGFAIDGEIAGFKPYAAFRDAQAATRVADETSGADMLYSSGTTGRPKGVKRALSGAAIDAADPLLMMTSALYGFNPDTRYLSPAPLYHAAPLRWCQAVHRLGGVTVLMEKFDPAFYLSLIAKHQINATQLVPTMFVRMLKLPPETRAGYDVSCLKMAVHAAAPCPVSVKEQMMAWWGPVIFEYYAGTEGNGFVAVTPQEWLAKKGTVGKAILGEIKICGDDGEELPAGQEGVIYFAGGPSFSYHNAPEKVAEATNRHGWTTLGDVGYLDADGYLFLTDRKAFMIISGGVNVYPQEIENLLITHPKVADAAVFGVPNVDFGEEVKAAIQLMNHAEAGPEMKADLLAFCRANLSAIKCPKSIDFHEALPRHATGKLYKRLLRDVYWGGRQSKIV